MQVTTLDEFGEQNKLALRWKAKATFQKDFAGYSASNKEVELEGAEILHFEGDKIKEAWSIFNCPNYPNECIYQMVRST